MIIDADCHISSRKLDALAITATELIAQMDRAGVDKALVWLKPPYNKEIAPENRAVYDAMRAYPDRLLGFGWVNPRLGDRAARDTIKQCFEEYGFYGIKFNGAQDEYVIDDDYPAAHREGRCLRQADCLPHRRRLLREHAPLPAGPHCRALPGDCTS